MVPASLSGKRLLCSACLWGTVLLQSCDTPQKQALAALEKSAVEASGRSLVKAVTENRSDHIAWLLEARVFTEQRDALGRTPLGIAVQEGNDRAALMLINAGANVNATLGGHGSILGLAATRSDEFLLDTLLASGAGSEALMPDGDMILPWAIRQGRLALTRKIMRAGSDPHLKDRHGNPLLHIAMETGRRDLTNALIELGADPGAVNAAGETTIHLALKQGWTDAIPKLANAGADPNAPGPDGLRPLERALARGDSQLAAMFLKIGADPNLPSPGNANTTPLERAFFDPDPALFSWFLAQGAIPPNGTWEPWLWKAFLRRDLEKTRLMLARGAREPHVNPHGRNLVEAATHRGDGSFVKVFLDFGFSPARALEQACHQGDAGIASLLLAAGADPNRTRFPSRDTLLGTAIRNRHDHLAALLVEHGADPAPVLPEGQSAFHMAVARGCPLTVKQLLARGADPNAGFRLPVDPQFLRQVRPGVMRWVLRMDRNATPLMLAADSGNVEVARLLKQAGAKSNTRTKIASLWPINFASRRGDIRMMRLFLGKDPHREERRIEIRLSEQIARMYDSEGREIFSTKVSTGRKGFATPTGEFVITNKHREWTSTLYDASMPYFQRLSCGDFGLHQGKVPGYPASHGCIRVPAGNAAKLFEMTRTGDRVSILP